MIEAISEMPMDWDVKALEQEENSEYPYLTCRNGRCVTCYARDPLHRAICQTFELADESSSNRELSDAVHKKLQEIGMIQFEKELGSGGSGRVIQIGGEGKKIALKLEIHPTPLTNKSQELYGDALGLILPAGHHLGRAFALLTFDGEEIHYIERYDSNLHAHHFLVGVFSKAVDGVPLGWKFLDLDSEVVQGYGKRLAEALLALHTQRGTSIATSIVQISSSKTRKKEKISTE